MSTKPVKIYLAGPEVFLEEPIEAANVLKALCIKHGAIGLFPLDNDIPDHIVSSATSASMAPWIRTANMEMIRGADAIIANMIPFRGPSMDVGTAYEMGVAKAWGKVVIGYSEDRRGYLERATEWGGKDITRGTRNGVTRFNDSKGWAIEDFVDEKGHGLQDNLMMACGVDNSNGGICLQPEEAIVQAVERVKQQREGHDKAA